MTLRELLNRLRSEPNRRVRRGLKNPHSYRGHYEDIAFELGGEMYIEDIIKLVAGSIGETYEGWKGGFFEMSSYSKVYVAEVGEVGDELGPILFRFLMEDQVGKAVNGVSVASEVGVGIGFASPPNAVRSGSDA
jgi:hypothetical protein